MVLEMVISMIFVSLVGSDRSDYSLETKELIVIQ